MIDPKSVVKIVKDHGKYLAHNAVLIDIFEGNLLEYVDAELKAQMSPQSYFQAQFRTVPINILPKIVDKLTNIYQTSVVREVEGGGESDNELLNYYVEKFDINSTLNDANEMFNLAKTSLLYPYVHNKEPKLRVILNDRFVPVSTDTVCPTRPTDMILPVGKKDGKDLFWVWDATTFVAVTSDEKVDTEEMTRVGNPMGQNPLGRLPFVYVNASKHKLIPKQDTDVLKLVKVIPVMLTDLNLAAMFQAFSIIYGIDLDDENLKYAPNSFWKFKSDATSDKKPEIGTLKPQVDYDQVLRLIETELSMWLGTKGIRASTVGALSPENFASGISKIIDEMDTFEARQKQTVVFQKAEAELWDLVLNYWHPYLVKTGQTDMRQLWTPGAKVKTSFAVQLPAQSRGVVVKDLREEYAAGFISRKRAVAKLNPHMTAAEVDQLIEEIDAERTVEIETEEDPNEAPETEET